MTYSFENSFKKTEIGTIPIDWEIDKLENHVIIKGRIGWKGLKVSEYIKSGPYIVGGLQLINDRVNWNLCEKVTLERYEESPEIMLKVGDILMTKDGTIGKLAFIDSLPNKATAASHIFVIRNNSKKLDQVFLFYYFKSSVFRNLIESRIEGSVVPALYQRDITKLKVTLPPIEEQKAIAYFLGVLDNKIELNRKINHTLDRICQLLFKRWFIDFEFPNDEGKPYKSRYGKMMDSELGKIPLGWQIGNISSIIYILSGGTPKTNVPEYWNGDIKWFTVKDTPYEGDIFVIDTEKKITKRGLENSAARIFKKGTTIITARGTVGKLALVGLPMSMNQTCYGMSGKDDYGDYFIYYLLRSKINQLKRQTHGTVFDTITRQTFDTIKIIIPPKELANGFHQLVAPIMEKILQNRFQSSNITNLRDILLPKLILGQIRLDLKNFIMNKQ
jgi:type I restriction enzyme S subunit